MLHPTGHERILVSLPPVLLTAQGTNLGRIVVTDNEYFKVNQIVVIGDPILPHIQAKVKRIDSPTQMVLGPVDKSVSSKDILDLSAYGVTSFIYAKEQVKSYPSIKEIEESMFEGEPTMARRTVLVDKYGRIYDSVLAPDGTLKLPVDISNISVVIQEPTDPEIITINATANIEAPFTLPAKTQRFKLKIRESKSSYKIRTTSGSSNYFSYSFGNTYESGEISTPIAKTLYVECSSSCVVELFCWKLP